MNVDEWQLLVRYYIHQYSCSLLSKVVEITHLLPPSSDFGFERVNLNSPCTPMQGTVYPQPPPSDCPENGTYSYTSGLVGKLYGCELASTVGWIVTTHRVASGSSYHWFLQLHVYLFHVR